MCGSCASYEHSRNCGPNCEDHDYQPDALGSDDEGDMYRCPRCGSCKYEFHDFGE